MDFGLIVAFLILYYIRPQEWIPALESLRPVLVIFLAAIVATLMRKPGFSPKDLLKTPHDWLMLIYLFWIAFSTASNGGYFTNFPSILVETGSWLWELKNYFGFYFIVMLALYNRERVEKFLWWWLASILALTILALAAEFGFDPLGSYEITHSPLFDGRLVININMFDNPNQLGHTVVPLIPLAYLLCVWRRSPLVKQIAFGILFIPLYCVFLTRSKGSAISGAIAGVVAFTFGRPKIIQAALIALTLSIGIAGMMMIPRMSDLKNPRAESGIQGRLDVFAFGYDSCWENDLLGYGSFVDEYYRVYGEYKASHSSYNAIGAELGVVGLTLYLAIYYCCLRTLITAKTRNVSEERIRRVLMGAIISFMVSSWMVSFAYHSTFFFLIASVAAFHRLLLKPAEEEIVEIDESGEAFYPISPLFSTASEGSNQGELTVEKSETEDGENALEEGANTLQKLGIKWNRFRILDFFGVLFMLFVTKKIWAYILFTWGR